MPPDTSLKSADAMMRIIIATNFIPDYRFQIFKRLLESQNSQFLFLTSSPTEESCACARQYLPLQYSKSVNLWLDTKHRISGGIQRERFPIPLNLATDIIHFRPQVIITGDFGLRSLICWLVAKLLRAKFVLWSEEISSSAMGRSWLQRRLRKFLARRANACLAWGRPAYSYLVTLGVESQCLFRCAQAVDNEIWMQRAAQLDRVQLRRTMNFSGIVFLLVGRMVARKGFSNFLRAWVDACSMLSVPLMAVFVGNGEQEQELRDLVDAAGLHNVRFEGQKQAEELAHYYAAADIFVFPSLEDVWGLVVNEALCFGLPVLASKFAGASQDLIADSTLGLVFDPSNHAEFVTRLVSLARLPPSIDRKRSHARLNSVSFNESYQAVTEMISLVTHEEHKAK